MSGIIPSTAGEPLQRGGPAELAIMIGAWWDEIDAEPAGQWADPRLREATARLRDLLTERLAGEAR